MEFDESEKYVLYTRCRDPVYIEQELARCAAMDIESRWRAAIDWFTGINYHTYNHDLSIEVARMCRGHPDADYLLEIADVYPPKDPLLCELEKRAMVVCDSQYGRKTPFTRHECLALYLAAMSGTNYNRESRSHRNKDFLRLAAVGGYAPAQVEVSQLLFLDSDAKSDKWLNVAFNQGDVRAAAEMSHRLLHYRSGLPPTEEDSFRGYKLAKETAALGNISSAITMIGWCRVRNHELGAAQYAVQIEPYQPTYIQSTVDFICGLRMVNLDFHSIWPALYLLGKTVHGHVCDDERQCVFGQFVDKLTVSNCKWVGETAIAWDAVVRESCVAWILIAFRLKVHKDIRRKLAKFIWESRKCGWLPTFCRDKFSESRDKIHTDPCSYGSIEGKDWIPVKWTGI